MITIKEYKEAKKENTKIRNLENSQDEIFEKKRKETYNKFWDLERALTDKKHNEVDKNAKIEKDFNEKIKKSQEPHCEKISAFEKVLEFIEISKNVEEINPVVYFYDYPRDKKGEVIRTEDRNYPEKEKQFINPLELIKNDEFAKIGVFIYKNDKPTNKYSLCVIGKTIFNSKVLEIPYSYGLRVHDDCTNIRIAIKDMPTKNDLMNYWVKNKDKVLKEFLEHYAEVEIEYKEVIDATKTKEWQKAYWEYKKDYYENSYSHGTETEEYKLVLKELEKLK